MPVLRGAGTHVLLMVGIDQPKKRSLIRLRFVFRMLDILILQTKGKETSPER
ncbi:hypothetical protein [Pseudomonas sp. 31-12]|uniref:hypothetical protein n=1 Tax=Pseudomonas sp. 31-12 TaxID=2201356 RepID=UPI0013A597DB|nr:hypothetical protein [Pseudomonas sp. 31-12]